MEERSSLFWVFRQTGTGARRHRPLRRHLRLRISRRRQGVPAARTEIPVLPPRFAVDYRQTMSAILTRKLALVSLLTVHLTAGVTISLQPSRPSPWQVGGIVTW